MGTEEVDSLDTHAVHADRLLESLRVVLTAGIQLAHSLNHLTLRNATAIVTQAHAFIIGDIHLDALARIHTELVNGVVDSLLEKNVDTILGVRTVTETSDIHTRTGTDMVNVTQVGDVIVVVLYSCLYLFFIYDFFAHFFPLSTFHFTLYTIPFTL